MSELDTFRQVNDKAFQVARELGELQLRNPTALIRDLNRFVGDHYQLELGVLSLIEEGKELRNGEDPTSCNFGRWLTSFKTGSPELQRPLAEAAEQHRAFHAAVKSIKTLVQRGQGEQALVLFREEMQPKAMKVFEIFDGMRAQAERADGLYRAMHQSVMVEARQKQQVVKALMAELIELNEDAGRNERAAAEHDSGRVMHGMLVGMLAGVLGGLLFGILLARCISRPLVKITGVSRQISAASAEMVRVAEQIADGNLAVRPPDAQITVDLAANENTEDETALLACAFTEMLSHHTVLGRAMQKMSEKLSKVISQVNEAAEQVASGSTQVSDAGQSLSRGATEQAASLEQVTSSIAEIGSQTRSNAENAALAKKLASTAREAAGKGGSQMQTMMAAMNDIQELEEGGRENREGHR